MKRAISLNWHMANRRLFSVFVIGRTAALAAALLMTGVIAVSANAQTNSTWIDGTGNWSVSTNWNPAVVPNNSGSITYSVTIGTSNSVVTMDVLNDTIDNLTLGATNTLNIKAGDNLFLLSGASSTSGTLTNYGGIINLGTINMDASFVGNTGTFNNIGTLSVTAVFDPGGFSNSGTFNNSGKFTMGGSFIDSFSNSGTINNSGAINLVDIGCFELCNPAVNSGTINNISHATLITSGTLDNSGTINNTSHANLTNDGILINGGTLNNTSHADLINSGTLDNFGTITDGGTINNTGTFTNSDAVTINKSGQLITSTNYSQTAGSTFVNGTLSSTGSAIVNIQGGTLGGGGTINGNVLMGGTIVAGATGHPLTLDINGNYDQTGAGIYTELISRKGNGLLNISGSATLDPGASLDIALLGGFDPKNGTSFTIMDYGTESGTFDISDPFFNGGTQQWVISSYNGGDGDDIVLTAEAAPVLTAEAAPVLTAEADPVTTPEPGTILLLGMGLLGVSGYAMKKRGAGAR